MMATHHRFSVFFAYFCLISVTVAASALIDDLLGVAPEDEDYYKSEVIKCKDGSKAIMKEQLNDDFCDCPDGIDEPGTSACPDGKFYCRNVGHTPLKLFSSRVNDGICDCCDGTDEYDGKVKCPNTCWQAGQIARDKLKKKIATYKDGVAIRKKEVEKAKLSIAKEEAMLSKLKNEEKILTGLIEQLKDQKDQIERLEEQDRRAKEEEEKRLKEAEKNESKQAEQLIETSHDEMKDLLSELPESENQNTEKKSAAAFEVENVEKAEGEVSSADAGTMHATEDMDDTMVKDETVHDAVAGSVGSSNLVKQEQGSGGSEGLSREELGRLVASRWTGENTGHQDGESDDAKDVKHQSNGEVPKAQDDDYDGYVSETDEDEHRNTDEETDDETYGDHEHDDDDPGDLYNSDVEDKDGFSDTEDLTGPSWLDKIQQAVRNILEAVNPFKTLMDKSEAARVREEYDGANQKLNKLQSRISSLTNKLQQDFGMEKQFYSFYGHCFENKQKKYVYKVCPFKRATQVEGLSTTQLGNWDGFEESYRAMQFTHGDGCWSGPMRSFKVRLRCGLNNELMDVDEPSRCEYTASLSTPALCLEERLKELQDKLNSMNMGSPQIHDEL